MFQVLMMSRKWQRFLLIVAWTSNTPLFSKQQETGTSLINSDKEGLELCTRYFLIGQPHKPRRCVESHQIYLMSTFIFFQGVLSDGREIAVKRLFLNNRFRAKDFYNEVNMISSVEHKNLVRLLGCSCSGPESILIYEYLPNMSLDRFIFCTFKSF